MRINFHKFGSASKRQRSRLRTVYDEERVPNVSRVQLLLVEVLDKIEIPHRGFPQRVRENVNRNSSGRGLFSHLFA